MNNKLNRLFELLSTERQRSSSSPSGTNLLATTHSDKARIIHSSAFRRLQKKAQVFPLETNAAVRSRLTHSLEVAQVGRYLAEAVVTRLSKSQDSPLDYEKTTAFVNIVESACLVHDIGNPPFGHLGEAAIREWFKNHPRAKEFGDDFIHFDGNPQGFRLLTRLAGNDDNGFNLTYSLLLSTVKYPYLVGKPGEKKGGYFSTEKDIYEKACNSLSWSPLLRFPIMILMNTADDIAYSLSDLEDALEKKIITVDVLKEKFQERAASFEKKHLNPFIAFKTDIINEAVQTSAARFCECFDEIVNGKKYQLLDKDEGIGKTINEINVFAQNNIYSHEEAEKVELAGRNIISGLLKHFHPILEMQPDSFLKLCKKEKLSGYDFERRLFNRLPSKYVEKYVSALKLSTCNELSLRAHLIIDYITGMTDDFALEIFQVLEGIKIR